MAAQIPTSGPVAAFLRYGCPGMGAGIAFVLFASPLPTVLAVARRGYLGDVNALPFAMMAANCAGWMFYGALLGDYFVYAANVPGLLGGLFYTLVCFRFSKAAAQNALTGIALASAALFSAIGAADMAVASPEASKTIWGSAAVSVLGLYYSAPLATLAKVVRERSSASLHWPMCLMNTVNGTLWFAYGLALRDWFICAPNGVGAAFNLVCLAFCLVFPRREQAGAAQGAADDAPAAERPKAAAAVPDLVGGNWGGLRLQSIRFPAPPKLVGEAGGAAADGGGSGASPRSGSPSPQRPLPPAAEASAAPGGGGSFLDLTAMRWRTGRSFLSLPQAGGRAAAGPRRWGAAAAARDGSSSGELALPPAARGAGGSRVALMAASAERPSTNEDDDAEAGGIGGGVIGRPIRESGEH
jgi:solute carrier family 50 protein (sugar transporter)